MLVADETLTFEAAVNATDTKTLHVLGEHLRGDVTLTLADESGYFSLNSDNISKEAAEAEAGITVTYKPKEAGEHTAEVTISSDGAEDVTVSLTGTATAAPVVTPTLVVGDASVEFTAIVGQTATKTFSVRGSNLTGGVTLTLADESGSFEIDPTTISKADAQEGADITVTYTPEEAGEHTATVTISSDGAESETVTLNGTATTPPDPTADRTFKLATKLSDLDGVTEIILVNPDGQTDNSGSVAMSTQNTNNRAATSITLSDNNNIATVPANNTSIVVLTLGKTTMTDDNSTTVYTFYDEAKSGYLYAASSSRNYLKTQTTLDDNVKATISIDSDGAATILFQGEYTRNSLRYNDDKESGNLFACYAETSDFPRAYIYYYEGNVEPTPELVVNPAAVNITANAGETATATFSVRGSNLTDEVTLTLTDANKCFSIDPATISVADADAEDGAEVTITFVAPSTGGNYSATVTVASAGATSAEVALSGSAVLKKAVPVMSAAVTETEVGDTWFDAKWTDATPVANVSSYTLYVNKVEETPEPSYELKQIGDFTNGKPEGWSNSTKGINWNKTSGYLQLGASSNAGTVTSPSIDFTGYTKATVIVNTKLWDSGSDMTVTIGESNSTTITGITGDYADHIAVVDISNISDLSDLTVTLGAASGQRLYVKNARIYAGDASSVLSSSGAPRLKEVVEAGDADDDGLVVTGITAKEYTVNGLTPGAKYDYKVKAVYVDEGESAWSNVEQVTLKLTPHTLAEMVADGTLGVGDSYAIADGNLLAVALSADGKTLFCKDANGYAQKQSASGSQVDYMVEYGFETLLEYDQSNWVALTSESALSGDLVGNYLTGVSGTVSDLATPSLALAAAPAVGESGSAYLAGTPNRFIPTSFMGESVVESGGKAFFFVAPKPVEVAIVTWACWNDSKFVSVPKTTYTKKDGVTSTMNPYNLQGEFTVDTKYLENWPTLTKDEVYEFTAVITREGGASPAPGRLKSATSAGGYGIYPLSAPTSIGSVGGTVTGITGVNGNGAAVESVRVYNVAGVEQRELQPGVNIVVTTYTDGTRSTAKVLR